MKALQILPDNYKEIFSVDLQKNKKTAVLVNAATLVIAGALAATMHFFVPITTLFDMQNGSDAYMIKFIILLVLIAVYVILHELVHGIAMKICGTKKVKYGFTGLYAFAGSNDYYDKKSYIMIALAPVVIWGIVLAIVNIFVPAGWFWVVYLIQIINLSGAAGDLFVTVKFSRLPKDILIRDYGISMVVYSKSAKTNLRSE